MPPPFLLSIEDFEVIGSLFGGVYFTRPGLGSSAQDIISEGWKAKVVVQRIAWS